MRKPSGWSLAQRLKSQITLISFVILLFVSATVAAHYGYDVSELKQRTVFDVAEEIAGDMPVDKTGAELKAAINSRHALFRRFPDAYEWYVLDQNGDLLATSVTTPVDRSHFPRGLPPLEWDAPSLRGGWEAGKTFNINGATRHVIAVAHSDPGGLLIGLAAGEGFIHIILPLLPFTLLISTVVSRILRRTLSPLNSLAQQAKRVQRMEDIQPLDPKDAPLEVAELVKALNISLEKLRISIEAEKQFLQDAAHALRTPLAIVKARLELDGDKVDLPSLLEEVESLSRLATQLLASANAERLVLRPEARANLSSLARDVVANITPLAIRADVDVGYSDDGVSVLVRGDADAISHALKNLIENGLKFTPRGKTVNVHVSHNPPTITVTDEGPGVPADLQEAIFNRHSRGKFGDGKGAGLGLSIVRRIMVAHQGAAEYVATPGTGATFRLTFPGSGPEPSVSEKAPPIAAATEATGKREAA